MKHLVRTARIAAVTAILSSTTLGSSVLAQDAAVREPGWCAVTGDFQTIEVENCRLAADGSVKVFWDDPALIDAATADALIDSTIEAMGRYEGLGLLAADISGINQVDIAVLPGDGSPSYSWRLGTISLGAEAAKQLAAFSTSATLELWHELFHSIEDEEYTMGYGAIFGDSTWWLETAAEVGTFLIEPAAVTFEANLYGRSTLADMTTLIFSRSPLQWDTEEYAQAQRVWASMCPSGCAFTRESFVAAINAGTYPLTDSATRTAFADGIERYAKYALTGELGDVATVLPFATGDRVGDHLAIIKAKDTKPWQLRSNSYAPQIDVGTGVIHAQIEADSIYPLLVASGTAGEGVTGGSYPPGQPAMLVVEPGAEYWYTVDGGAVQHHDGQSELVLGPLHSALGIGKVRFVAVAREAPATFTAHLDPVDLSGDWVFAASKSKLVDSTCKESADLAKQIQQKDVIGLLSQLAATKGTYVPAKPDELTWDQQKPFKLDPKQPGGFFYVSDVQVNDEDIIAHLEFSTEKIGKDAGMPIGLAVALVPFGLLSLVRRKRAAAFVAVLVIASLASGCVGVGDIKLSASADFRFTHLEWTGGPTAAGAAVGTAKTAKSKKKTKSTKGDQSRWKLSGGQGKGVVDYTVTISSGEGKNTKETSDRCVLTFSFANGATVYPDNVVKAPEL